MTICGIVGLISRGKHGLYAHHRELFTNMLQMDSIRGEDSTGVFGVSKEGAIDILKGDTNGWTFTQCDDYDRFAKNIVRDYQIIVGHNRKATKGAVTAQNAHPFTQKHITLVHNGTIFNAQELNKEVEVDSEAIAHALAEHDAVAALKKLHGAFALVWYDKKDKTLSVVRNGQRTLYYLKYDTHWVLSSEIGLPLWLQGRENRKSIEWKACPTDKILTFPLSNLEAEPIELAYEEYKLYTPPTPRRSHFPHATGVPVVKQLAANVHQFPALLKNKVSEVGLKYGDVVKFKLDTYEEEDVSESMSLLGHPIFEKDMDTNMWVKAILPKGEKVESYIAQGDIFTATVQNVRPMGGRIIIFAKDPVVCNIVRDLHGEENKMDEVLVAIKAGCGVCLKDIHFRDIEKSVVQQRKDGTWRLRCRSCVENAYRDAQRKSTLVIPASTHVQ